MTAELDINKVNSYIELVEQLEINQKASLKQKEQLEQQIRT